jgi:hypothetical protein
MTITLRQGIKFAKHFKARIHTCCGDPLYIDVTATAVRKLLKPYLSNDHDKDSTYESNFSDTNENVAWAMNTTTGFSFLGHTETFEHRCECDDASIAVLNKSTKTMIVGY